MHHGQQCSPPVSPQNPELEEEPWGRRAARRDTPFSPAPWPPPYLLLLLLCHQVCVAVHSLFRLVLLPAALLVEPLGLGEPPNRAGACQQATRCTYSSGEMLSLRVRRWAQAASRAGDRMQGPGCLSAWAKPTSQDKLLFVWDEKLMAIKSMASK